MHALNPRAHSYATKPTISTGPPPPLNIEYILTLGEVKKRYGTVTTATACTLLITPHEHNGMLYHRRMIHHRTTIYCDATKC
jgi:hypothetical protein